MATEIERDHFELTGEAGYAGLVACSYCSWESTDGDLVDVLEKVRQHQDTWRRDG